MRIWLKNPAAVLADNSGGGVVVENGVIVQCVAAGAQPATAVDETFDAGNHVLLPGLINTHHHFYQTLTRAHPAAINRALFDWLGALYPIWRRLTPEAIVLSSELAMAEMLLSGVTCAVDHHYVFPAGLEHAIDLQVEVAQRLGMRVVLTRGSMSLSQDDGGLPPREVVQSHAAIIADSERLLNRYHDRSNGAMVQIALAPCSPFSVTSELMRDTAALARNHDCRLHTHLAETHDETDFCLATFGRRPLDHLEDLGWMGPQTWLAHGIHFDDGEIARLGAAGVGIAHCPTSNMTLGSGQCRTLDLEAAGAPVGLAVDGSASNDASNMMEEVRHALLLGRLTYGADRVSHLDALRWGTAGSAECLGRDDIGSIRVGAAADLALFRLDRDLRFSGGHDPLATLVLCGASRADRVMVGGRWVVVDGEVTTTDTRALRERHHAMAMKLFA